MVNKLDKIKEILIKEREVKVSSLSHRLGLSEVTIRKHLCELERLGIVIRRYGGALLTEIPLEVMSTTLKMEVNSEAKREIAQAAADLIQDGENILLDAGSTTLALAACLRERSLRVVTNSLLIAGSLIHSPEITVEVIGGSLRKTSGALIGPHACSALREIRVDRVFLACSGFDEELGVSSENTVEAQTKAAMLNCGKEIILLADHSKFERPAFAPFASVDDFDQIITDQKTKLPDSIKAHVRLTLAKSLIVKKGKE